MGLTKNLTFYKEESGSWYIDLPEWEGSKADLLMVAGADTLLDMFGKERVTLIVGEVAFFGCNLLVLQNEPEDIGGGEYLLHAFENDKGIVMLDLSVWLCDVTKFVFGGYMPKLIYFKEKKDGKEKENKD